MYVKISLGARGAHWGASAWAAAGPRPGFLKVGSFYWVTTNIEATNMLKLSIPYFACFSGRYPSEEPFMRARTISLQREGSFSGARQVWWVLCHSLARVESPLADTGPGRAGCEKRGPCSVLNWIAYSLPSFENQSLQCPIFLTDSSHFFRSLHFHISKGLLEWSVHETWKFNFVNDSRSWNTQRHSCYI